MRLFFHHTFTQTLLNYEYNWTKEQQIEKKILREAKFWHSWFDDSTV